MLYIAPSPNTNSDNKNINPIILKQASNIKTYV